MSNSAARGTRRRGTRNRARRARAPRRSDGRAAGRAARLTADARPCDRAHDGGAASTTAGGSPRKSAERAVAGRRYRTLCSTGGAVPPRTDRREARRARGDGARTASRRARTSEQEERCILLEASGRDVAQRTRQKTRPCAAQRRRSPKAPMEPQTVPETGLQTVPETVPETVLAAHDRTPRRSAERPVDRCRGFGGVAVRCLPRLGLIAASSTRCASGGGTALPTCSNCRVLTPCHG